MKSFDFVFRAESNIFQTGGLIRVKYTSIQNVVDLILIRNQLNYNQRFDLNKVLKVRSIVIVET